MKLWTGFVWHQGNAEGEIRMKTIKEWSENEERREESEGKRVMSLPLDGSQSEEGRGSEGARRGCVFLTLQHQQ